MTVTVYSKPDCVQCKYTIKHLEKLTSKGVRYKVIDVTQDAEARKVVEATGNTTLPYVVTEHGSWHGFKIDSLRGLTSQC
jgi:glutaredoxin-like protein NrdH